MESSNYPSRGSSLIVDRQKTGYNFFMRTCYSNNEALIFSLVTKSLSLIFIAVTFISPVARAAEGEGEKDTSGKNIGLEAGFQVGNLLPNQIGGVTEIIGMGGVRAGYRLGTSTFGEGGFTTGNGSGVEWKNFEMSIRMEAPIEHLVAIAYIGPDLTYYHGVGDSNRVIFGGHVGGGLQAQLGGATWFRADMKFAASPGTSLYISAGLMFRLPGGGGGGGGE